MNLLKTFESRVSDAFGAGPQGYAAPFSFKKLAKKAAREMEGETFEIDGVDTAPALYTVLVSSADDSAMRPLYTSLTREIVAFVEAQAQAKSYVFVGKPLARFMVDPSLKAGRFAVFAENIDAHTLGKLREEEEAFLTGSAGLGGAAAQLQPIEGPAADEPVPSVAPIQRSRHTPLGPQSNRPDANDGIAGRAVPTPITRAASEEFAPLTGPVSEDASAGLNVIPADVVDEALQDPPKQAAHFTPAVEPVAVVPLAPATPVAAAAHAVPATQRRNVPLVNHQRQSPTRDQDPEKAACLLIDHQSGRTYTGVAPTTTLGRERTPGGIVLHDPNVSRRHAELSFDGRSWHITDLGSTNGTLVNDVDIDSHTLQDGDLITVGLTNLEFRESRS